MLAHLPALLPAALLIFAFAVPIIYRYQKEWAKVIALFALALSFAMSISLLLQVRLSGIIVYYMGGWAPPFGIEFKIDFLSVYMLLIITGISLVVLIFGIPDLRHELNEKVMGWYYTLYLLLVASMVGMAITNDLFNLFVFMEICAIASCAIISIKKERECLEASFKYLILSAMGTGCYLLAVALLYMITGHLNYDMVSEVLTVNAQLYPNNILLAMSLMIVAFGLKAALFPLHVWLPDAHASAPTASSAVLSGLVIKIYAFGFFSLVYRVFPREAIASVPILEIVLWLSAVGVVFGSILAMGQSDFKKMLAYSSIAQIGYVFMGIGLNSEKALIGGLIHILNHAVMKAMLFMVAGTIIYASGRRRIDQFAGIGSRLPFTMIAFLVGGVSMVGIPLTGGFIGKLYLVQGAIESEKLFFIFIILISSFLNAIYYFPIAINAFWGESKEPLPEFRPVPMAMKVAIGILLLSVFFFGIYPGPVTGMLERGVEMMNIFGN